MIFNDTLQKCEEWFKQFELEREVFETEQASGKMCDIKMKACKRNCYFDYGP